MKLSIVLTLVLLSAATFAQTTYRVNADATVTGVNVYHTLQAAHDAASNGDIIIVDPGASVGNLSCIKTLTIYGRGYFLDKNPNFANLPDKNSMSTAATIDIYANNCKISGMFVTNNLTLNGGASGTVISRNYLYSVVLQASAASPVNNTMITQNYANYVYMYPQATGYINNVTISNNQLTSVGFQGYTSVASNYYSNILIDQNTLANLSTAAASAVISNNIFATANQTSLDPSTSLTNVTINNNVTFGTTAINPGLGANNIVISNTVGQFNSNTGGSDDNNYRIANGSLMKTASSSGGEVGMFGGDTPYIQYGIPAAPSVIKLFNTGIGNTSTPVTATVSATSNN